MCIMFHLMMGGIFCFQKQGIAKKLIGILMFLVAAQYVKDLFLLNHFYAAGSIAEFLASSIDIVTVPMYAMVLVEFCRPGWVTFSRALFSEAPFVMLSLLYLFTHFLPFFYAMVMLTAVYGVWCAVWAIRELPRYHQWLKEEYSYDEDINLHWLRGVVGMFFVILSIWVLSNIYSTVITDILYMLSSLIGWSVVCYFINKQEMVLHSLILDCDVPSEEQSEGALATTGGDTGSDTMAALMKRLQVSFDEQKVYLDPKLRLSELAASLGTNRTYLSQYFNQSCEQSFYEYVNAYRVRHAMRLLLTTDYTLDIIASMSGFNSLSTFRRAFTQQNGCSPLQFKADGGVQRKETPDG